jgi:hypothetical protein
MSKECNNNNNNSPENDDIIQKHVLPQSKTKQSGTVVISCAVYGTRHKYIIPKVQLDNKRYRKPRGQSTKNNSKTHKTILKYQFKLFFYIQLSHEYSIRINQFVIVFIKFLKLWKFVCSNINNASRLSYNIYICVLTSTHPICREELNAAARKGQIGLILCS